jgi:hypothetical protein
MIAKPQLAQRHILGQRKTFSSDGLLAAGSVNPRSRHSSWHVDELLDERLCHDVGALLAEFRQM